MSKKTKKARTFASEKWKKQEENRSEEIYNYLEDNPNQTAYSLSKNLGYSLKTVQNILDKLVDEGIVKIRQFIDRGRGKKVINTKDFVENSFEHYNEEFVTDQLLDQLILKVKDSKGIVVFIHRKDGSIIELTKAL